MKLSPRQADALLVAPGYDHGFEQHPGGLGGLSTLGALERRGLIETRLASARRGYGLYAHEWEWKRTFDGENLALAISLAREAARS